MALTLYAFRAPAEVEAGRVFPEFSFIRHRIAYAHIRLNSFLNIFSMAFSLKASVFKHFRGFKKLPYVNKNLHLQNMGHSFDPNKPNIQDKPDPLSYATNFTS